MLDRLPPEVWEMILESIPHTEAHRLMFILGKSSYMVIKKAFFRAKDCYLLRLTNPPKHRISAELIAFIRAFKYNVTNDYAKCFAVIQINCDSPLLEFLKALDKTKFEQQRVISNFSGLSIRIGSHVPDPYAQLAHRESIDPEALSSRLSAALRDLSRLEHLHLAIATTALPPAFALSLTSLTSLVSLDLSGSSCSDDACAALAAALRRLPHLRALAAANCGISAAGMAGVRGGVAAKPLARPPPSSPPTHPPAHPPTPSSASRHPRPARP